MFLFFQALVWSSHSAAWCTCRNSANILLHSIWWHYLDCIHLGSFRTIYVSCYYEITYFSCQAAAMLSDWNVNVKKHQHLHHSLTVEKAWPSSYYTSTWCHLVSFASTSSMYLWTNASVLSSLYVEHSSSSYSNTEEMLGEVKLLSDAVAWKQCYAPPSSQRHV